MKIVILLSFFIFCSIAHATPKIIKSPSLCFKVSNLKGVSNTSSEGEKFEEDGFSDKEFEFHVNKNKVYTNDINMQDIKYFFSYPINIIGVYSEGNATNIETWVADINTKKVYFNRTRVGFSILNGSSAYIGDLKKCNQ